MTNTLAYYKSELIATIKKFYGTGPWACEINHYRFVMYILCSKLG